VLKYIAKDIYSPIIISPFHNTTDSNGKFDIYVTSDLWSSAAGTAKLSWSTWSGKLLNLSTPSSIPVSVGAINTTLIYSTNINTLLEAANLDPKDVVLKMTISMTGSLPNSNSTQTFTHENWFHPVPLSQAKLLDPGLTISHQKSEPKGKIVVEASNGVAAWVWLDYTESPNVLFSENGFWLGKGEKKEVGVEIVKPEGFVWKGKPGVSSLWDVGNPRNGTVHL
jgi:beta-mannosidase